MTAASAGLSTNPSAHHHGRTDMRQQLAPTWYFLMSASDTERRAYFMASSKWARVRHGTASTSSSMASPPCAASARSRSMSFSMFSLHARALSVLCWGTPTQRALQAHTMAAMVAHLRPVR